MGGMGGQRRGVSNFEIWLMIHGLGTQVTVVTSRTHSTHMLLDPNASFRNVTHADVRIASPPT
jgi:hypothetical protein